MGALPRIRPVHDRSAEPERSTRCTGRRLRRRLPARFPCSWPLPPLRLDGTPGGKKLSGASEAPWFSTGGDFYNQPSGAATENLYFFARTASDGRLRLMPTQDSFAKRFAALRMAGRQKKVPQEEIAAFVGVSQATISEWERGKTTTSVPELAKLCDFFSVSADYLTLRSTHPQALPSDCHLVEEEMVQAIRSATSLDDVERFVDRQPTQLQWNVRVPRTARLVPPREFDALLREIEPKVQKLLKEHRRTRQRRHAGLARADCRYGGAGLLVARGVQHRLGVPASTTVGGTATGVSPCDATSAVVTSTPAPAGNPVARDAAKGGFTRSSRPASSQRRS